MDWVTAAGIFAVIGIDKTALFSANYLTWTGMCLGNHQSAGKQKSNEIRNPLLATSAVAAAKDWRLTKLRTPSTTRLRDLENDVWIRP